MRFLKLAACGALALSIVAAVPAFAAKPAPPSQNGPTLDKEWMSGRGGAAVTGPAHWHNNGGAGLIGVHGRHLTTGQSVTAAAFTSSDCSGKPVATSSSVPANQRGHVVEKIHTNESAKSIGSAGLLGSNGALLSCATEHAKKTSASH